MIWTENLAIAVRSIRANAFRSVLTTLGIIIGVAAVIAVVSIVQGLSQYITSFLENLGSNVMWVYARRPPGEAGERLGRIELDLEDAQAIRAHCPEVISITPVVQESAAVTWRDERARTIVVATRASFQEDRNYYVSRGRFITEMDDRRAAAVCVVGPRVLENLGLRGDPLGEALVVNGRRFKIVGVLEKKGTFFGGSQDDFLVIPFAAGRKLFGPDQYRQIVLLARARQADAVEEARSQVISLLRRRHQLRPDDPDDFEVQTQDQTLEQFHAISGAITAVVGGVVGISLLVGGIGIMNIMLVSVTERTREIGIRKAVGARRSTILGQFLIEAVILALVGGFIGILLGYAAGLLVAALSPLPSAFVPWWSILISVGFSAAVGIFFGIYPAMKAARLDPIEALRHE